MWWEANKDRKPHHFIVRLVPFLFDVVDALYLVTRNLPLHPVPGTENIDVKTPYTINIGIILNTTDFTTLRSLLALTGDITNITRSLIRARKDDPLLELEQPIRRLYKKANKFQSARNFFSHFDIMMIDMQNEGISGPINTSSGVNYSSEAISCVHMIWRENRLYFTKGGKERVTIIDKEAFNPIFERAEEIYRVLISHPNSDRIPYDPVESLYPRT
jgi:hypothetical protein